MLEHTVVPSIGVVILAAGQGKRMNSDLPKVMHLLSGMPLVEHVVNSAIGSGLTSKPVVVVAPDSTLIRKHLEGRVEYAVQERQLGTGHAVAAAGPVLRDRAGHVIVLYGDMPFVSMDSIRCLADHHCEKKNVVTMMTATTPDFDDWRSAFTTFGRVIRDGDGHVQRIVEWKDANESQLSVRELSTCVFCFEASWLWDHLEKLGNNNVQKEYYLTDLVDMAVMEKVPIGTVGTDLKEVLGVNSKEDLEQAHRLFQE